MANTKTAKKQLLVTRRNTLRNVHYKTIMKSAVKQATGAIEGDDKEAAVTALNNVKKVLHRTATRGIIKRKNASRKISRLTHAFNRKFQQAAE